MTEVFLHVYDVTSSGSSTTNTAVVQINKLLRGGIGVGGIFHSAVEVYDYEEWSFGYCESGSGVFSSSRKENPMYCYRESLYLGRTSLSRLKVTQILCELGREWAGSSYDVLSRNCNHFCDVFCERLGVQKLPAWVNRFAHAGDVAVEAAETTIKRLRQAKTDFVSASKFVYRFLTRGTSTSSISPDPGAVNDIAPNTNNVNLLRLTFLKSPAIVLSKFFFSINCFGFREQALVEKSQIERTKDVSGPEKCPLSKKYTHCMYHQGNSFQLALRSM